MGTPRAAVVGMAIHRNSALALALASLLCAGCAGRNPAAVRPTTERRASGTVPEKLAGLPGADKESDAENRERRFGGPLTQDGLCEVDESAAGETEAAAAKSGTRPPDSSAEKASAKRRRVLRPCPPRTP